MTNGDAVANVRLATTESWKDKSSGERREVTEWHRVVFYRKLAEIVGQYLKKGSSVYIEGRIRTRKWQDKEGQERYTTEIEATEMQMLGRREGSGAPAGDSYGGGSAGGDYERSAAPAPAKKKAPSFDDMKEVFAGNHPIPLNEANVLGSLSLFFWALIVVVSLKYVAFIMRADNRGEGGIMALIALALHDAAGNRRRQKAVVIIGILGAAMFYGDGMVTPAMSVLSAVEGLEIASPGLDHFVIPITLLVLFALFAVQKRGTATVGALFGPVMVLWFSCLALLGIGAILHNPHVLLALNPLYGVKFLLANQAMALVAMGNVVLAVTGAEALYADMGHFGRRPIQLAWFTFVLPALVLNYFGQGALILAHSDAIQNPFFLSAPKWALYPLVGLSTVATVIASQAVISGAFSVTRQAMQLGFVPRMEVQHTSEKEQGQIYLPGVNWGLFCAVAVLVLGFKSSNNLAAAYGIAVTGDMVITSLLATAVVARVWGWGWPRAIALFTGFLVVELTFLSANVMKIPDGGWFPLVVGVAVFVMYFR